MWLPSVPCHGCCMRLASSLMQWLLLAPCTLLWLLSAPCSGCCMRLASSVVQWLLWTPCKILWLPCSGCCMRLAVYSGVYQRHALAAACALQGLLGSGCSERLAIVLWLPCSGCCMRLANSLVQWLPCKAIEGLALLSCNGMLWL